MRSKDLVEIFVLPRGLRKRQHESHEFVDFKLDATSKQALSTKAYGTLVAVGGALEAVERHLSLSVLLAVALAFL